MAKIPRKAQKIFGSNAGSSGITKFGSVAAGSPAFSTDLDEIQSLTAYQTGWLGAVMSGTKRKPVYQDRNALDYLFSTQLANIFQDGGLVYNSATTYYIGCPVRQDGTTIYYKSLVDNNVGNLLTDDTKWQLCGDLTNLYQILADTIIYVATTGSDTTGNGTSAKPFASIQGALNYLNGKTLLGAVTIQVADGTYTITNSISINHPQSSSIGIIGNLTAPANCIIKTTTSGISVFSALYGATLNIDGFKILGNLTQNGIWVWYNSVLSLGAHIIIDSFQYGISIGYSSTGSISGATIQNCSINNLQVISCSSVAGTGCSILGNPSAKPTAGVQASMHSNAFITSSTITNATYGITASGASHVYTTGNTYSGNTTNLTPAGNTVGNSNSFITVE